MAAPLALPDPLLRRSLRARMHEARARTDELFELLHPAGFLERPIAERHRLVFYLGHLEAFDWNLLGRDCAGLPSRRRDWEQLFAFGINPVDSSAGPTGGGLPTDAASDWPGVGEIRDWSARLRDEVDRVVGEAPLAGWLAGGWAIHLAIEHRLMHAETLCYLLHRLPPGARRDGPAPDADLDRPAPPRELVAIPAGPATLGLARDRAPHLGWDNEYEEHVVRVPAFRIERHPVTNADFLRFVEAGGYHERRHFTDTDWAWLQREGRTLPAFWAERPHARGRLVYRAMFGEVPLPPSWPVYVSHAEAAAYARWAGRRLPTEAEWHRAALGTPGGDDRATRAHPWGDAPPVPELHGRFGGSAFDPAPVDAHPAGASAFGVHGLVGNGWQWTSTVFAPFDGFRPLPFYRGYSADFFDGKHHVMKGASPRTDPTFLRRSFRNWFQGHYPHVYATFRCAEDA